MDALNTLETIIHDSKSWSALNAESLRSARHPFTNNSSTKITRKAFLTYRAELINLYENNTSAACVMGEMRSLERIMRYIEETDIFSGHPDRADFHADMIMLLKGLSDRMSKEFDCVTNVTDKYANDSLGLSKNFPPKIWSSNGFHYRVNGKSPFGFR